MKFLDKRFSRNKLRYASQCLLTTVVVIAILMALDAIENAAVIAALGASAFIAFAMPHTKGAQARYMLGGYLVGVAMAALCNYLATRSYVGHIPFVQDHPHVVFGGMAVGLTTFTMAITNTEHPPAAGVALGLVLGEWSAMTVGVVLIGILSLTIASRLLSPLLMDLVETAPSPHPDPEPIRRAHRRQPVTLSGQAAS